LTNKAASAK